MGQAVADVACGRRHAAGGAGGRGSTHSHVHVLYAAADSCSSTTCAQPAPAPCCHAISTWPAAMLHEHSVGTSAWFMMCCHTICRFGILKYCMLGLSAWHACAHIHASMFAHLSSSHPTQGGS